MKKTRRIRIKNLNEYKQAVYEQGESIRIDNSKGFIETVTKTRDIERTVLNELYDTLSREETVFRVNNIDELIDYIEKQIYFEQLHAQLQNKLSNVQTLMIHRIEYEREETIQEDVAEAEVLVKEVAKKVSSVVTAEEYKILQEVEQQIQIDHVFAKDIELLKKIVIVTTDQVKETYHTGTKVNTIEITMPHTLSKHYMKAPYGSVEYYQQLGKDSIRLGRLVKHLDQYIKVGDTKKSILCIDQSKALQDSINIVVAVYNNQVYKAISGHDEINGFHKATSNEEAAFTSRKVNRHGKLGLGYDRSNDSEKKILETIHKEIQAKRVKSTGVLTLYSKWEPCPSCYLVIHQFQTRYPGISIEVKYKKSYGLLKQDEEIVSSI